MPSAPSKPTDLVYQAVRGDDTALRALLLRRSGLPGPRANWELAKTVAGALTGEGSPGRKLLDDYRAMGTDAAPAGSAYPILPIVGVVGLGVAAARGGSTEIESSLESLQHHAEDPRREVRDAVEVALRLPLLAHPEQTVALLRSWTDGYFHAELMLRALADGTVLEKVTDETLLIARLQEVFALVADAPRAHRRSQGYRSLLRAMSAAIASVGKRFPHPVAQWIEAHAAVASEDLRAALEASVQALRTHGLRAGDAEDMQRALDAAIPPPRDPRSDVGPTRGRGKRGRRRGRR